MASSAILTEVSELLIAVVVVVAVYLLARRARSLLRKRIALPKSQPIVHEFWIWTPSDRLPSSDSISRRLLRRNPHNTAEKPALTTSEALLFTDVRTHIALSLPAKNRHLFDPNFFSEEAEVPPESHEAMRTAKAMVIVRFVSEEPMPDREYMHFITHLADAVADLMGSDLIYDREAMYFYPGEAWKTEMMSYNARQTFERVVKLHSVEEPNGWWLHTHGFRKLGLPDLEMCQVGREQKTICENVLRAFAERVFENPSELKDSELEHFGRTHRVILAQSERGTRHHRGLVLELIDTTSMVDQILYES